MSQHFSNLRNNKHHCEALQRAYNKYGENSFSVVVLEQCDKSIIIDREQWWLDNHKNKFIELYNSSMIAGRIEQNKSVILKIRNANMGRKASQETKERMSRSHTGLKASAETIAKMSASMSGTGKSKAAGVGWYKRTGKWQAYIRVNNKHIHLGTFKELGDAIAARRAGEEKYLDTTPQSMPTTTPTQTEEAK